METRRFEVIDIGGDTPFAVRQFLWQKQDNDIRQFLYDIKEEENDADAQL